MEDKKQKTVIQKAHEAAWKKAEKKIPKMDTIVLLKTIIKTLQAEPDERNKKINDAKSIIIKCGAVYIETFAQTAINGYLKNTDNEVLKKLGKNNLGKEFVVITEQVGSLVGLYMNHQISPEQLREGLESIQYDKAASKIVKAMGLEDKVIDKTGAIQIANPLIAVAAFQEAYKIYCKALDDLELAKEERARIEAECNESVRMMLDYREELNSRVSDYLTENIEAFQEGFALMDQAILMNDSEGYIAGNVEIQKMLGYDIQFTNQEEFDDLMMSDDAFKF